MTATQVTAMCNIFTEVVGINMGNDTTMSAPQTTCTSTKRRITQGCEVTGTTTTMFESCTRKQTATEITKFCTESVSAGVTYTPCTKTASTVFEGCSVTATTTSVIDDVCQAQVTLAPDDPQGEFGMLPANSSNETCPYFPGVNVTVLDDQGADGQQNDTCPMPNGTRTSFDDDQGDDDPKSSCQLNNGTAPGGEAPSCPLSNATLIQGPDGAEDGNVTASCPLNSTIVYEPDGALDSDTAPSCNATFGFNMTMEQELGQGEDGLKSNQSCPLGNSTLEVDNEQGEDGPSTEDDSCPVIPDGIILSPLADLGDYAATNESECPALDDRFPISWLDEQGDDWQPEISTFPVPGVIIEKALLTILQILRALPVPRKARRPQQLPVLLLPTRHSVHALWLFQRSPQAPLQIRGLAAVLSRLEGRSSGLPWCVALLCARIGRRRVPNPLRSTLRRC